MNALDSRRCFLARTGQGMVWLSLGGLAACGGGDTTDPGAASGGGNGGGGGGGGNGGSGGGTAGTAFTLAQRVAALEAVRERVASLAAGSSRFDTAALVQALQSMPAFDSVGSSTAVGNVWARFTDGRYLVVPDNLTPAPATGQSLRPSVAVALREQAAASGGDAMPAKLVAQQYRQLDMLGQVPFSSSVDAAHLSLDWVDEKTLPQLRKMAVGCGFMLPEIQTARPPDGDDIGIDGLKTVRDDGVFFITACAAQVGDDATARTVICSGTVANEANLTRLEADLAAGLLVYAVAMRGVEGRWEPVPCLAFGPEFVAEYRWRFPVDSIAIFNVTGAPSLSDWVPVLYAAGVRHILAWQRPVSWQRLLAFGDDLIQLNLATNSLDGRLRRQNPEPRLRSYGMGETLEHLQRRGVASDGNPGDALFYLQENQPALMVNSLLPTIDYATLNENTLAIELVGQFGRAVDGSPLAASPTAPASARMPATVVIGTRDSGRFGEPLLARAADPLLEGWQPLANPQWPGELLQTVLRPDDLARGGYLQVVNGGRCSNVVPITHWEIPIQTVTTIDELTLNVTITLRIRADVHAWRLGPEAFPRNGASQGAITASIHSRIDYQASGSISHDAAATRTRTTVNWSGSGGRGNALGDFVVNASLALLWDSRETLLATLNVAHASALHAQQTVTEQFDVNGQLLRRSEVNGQIPVSVAAGGPGANGVLQFRFDQEWNLLAGSFEMLPVDSNILPAPPQRTRRTRLTWPQVRPDFAPREDFGGT